MFAVFVILSPAFLAGFVQGERIHSTGKFEIATESQTEDGSDEPPFDPRAFNSMLRPFTKSAPQPCGTRLLTTVLVNETMKKKIIESTQDFFKEKNGLLVAVGDGWKNFSPNHAGILPILDGHQLDAEGKGMSLKWVRNLVRGQSDTQTYMRFTFYVGIDMRNCWPDIYDLTNREVCGAEVLQGLLRDMANVEPVFDQTGQSGSTIVTNVEGFIVKNTKDANEYETLREVMTSFGNNIRDRHKFSCYGSALAPICVAFQLPGPQGDVQWMAMRKIEIPNGRGASVMLDLPGGETGKVKDIDLKGPKFANSLRDGKTYFGSAAVWTKKDTGFAKMFPQGLKLRGCGSRDAAYTLELDAELLLNSKMTDYSLYGKFYAPPPEDKYNCVCENSGHSTFPLVLDVEKGDNNEPLRIAVGIIDYLEKKVSPLDRFLPTSMSTMKRPKQFKEWWMRMWPSYFHLPDRQLNESGLISANDHARAEIFKSGQRVRALMKIKWFGGKEKHRTTKTISGKAYKVYSTQITEESSNQFSHGSKYKVIAGDEGTIVSIEDGYLFVKWDAYKNKPKIYTVTPDQVIAFPPIFG